MSEREIRREHNIERIIFAVTTTAIVGGATLAGTETNVPLGVAIIFFSAASAGLSAETISGRRRRMRLQQSSSSEPRI